MLIRNHSDGDLDKFDIKEFLDDVRLGSDQINLIKECKLRCFAQARIKNNHPVALLRFLRIRLS